MKTTILQNRLAAASKTMRGLLAKDALNPFSKVRFDVAGPNVSLAGGNEMIQITCRFEGVTESDGMVMLPGTYLDKFIGAMNGEVTIEERAMGKVTMKTAGLTFNMGAADVADAYSMVGPDEANGRKVEVSGLTFREMLRKVRYAASTDTTRKVLVGVYMEIDAGLLCMTATDGRRLAHVEKDVDAADGKMFGVTLPNKTVETLYQLLGEEDVTVIADDKAVRVVADEWTLVSKVYAETYPQWRRVVPPATAHRVTLRREAFLEQLRAAALVFNANAEKSVKVTLKKGVVVFKSHGDITDAETQMPGCDITDEAKVTFKFNPDLLVDALGCLDDDTFTLEYNGGEEAVVLKSSIQWLSVIMPQKVR